RPSEQTPSQAPSAVGAPQGQETPSPPEASGEATPAAEPSAEALAPSETGEASAPSASGLPPHPASARMASLRIETMPVGAEVRVDGVTRGNAPLEVQLPEGGEVKIEAFLPGHRVAASTIQVKAPMRPLRLTLEALPYRLEVRSVPDRALVRVGNRQLKAPASVTLPRPTAPLRISASLPGHEPAELSVEPSEFREEGDAMVARLEIALKPLPSAPAVAQSPVAAASRGRRPARGEGAAGATQQEGATRVEEAPKQQEQRAEEGSARREEGLAASEEKKAPQREEKEERRSEIPENPF
ncbi:MAG: PEGA domain-containing protein, partial [Sandaracinaceae bacterium]|nr:PEGA domain-containing protein [Sandaracinaceae bacterium]